MLTVSDFRARFAQFADTTEYPDTTIQLHIDDAKDIYMGEDEVRWGTRYDFAAAYLTAHLLTVSLKIDAGQTSVSVGPIQTKTSDGVSVTRAITAKDRSDLDDFLLMTAYGQQYLIARNSTFAGILAVH